jgi:hypothetical protein
VVAIDVAMRWSIVTAWSVDLLRCRRSPARLLRYEWSGTVIPRHRVTHVETPDVEAAVRELRARGVVFD